MSIGSPPHGFTLIELLVALFITAILFVMGYGAVNQSVQHRAELQEQQARLLEVETAMRVMAQDFGEIAPRPVREAQGSNWVPAFIAQGPSQTGSSASSLGAALMTFTRTGWANPAGIQRPALERVSYYFEKETLRREHLRVLDPTLASEPLKRDLLAHLKSVTFRYLNGGQQWVDHWPDQIAQQSNDPGLPAQRTRPLAVEVDLELTDWGKVKRIFEVPQ